jgi:hypothetical protein
MRVSLYLPYFIIKTRFSQLFRIVCMIYWVLESGQGSWTGFIIRLKVMRAFTQYYMFDNYACLYILEWYTVYYSLEYNAGTVHGLLNLTIVHMF